MDKFEKRLQSLLEKNNLNQKELAEKVGVTEVTISRYMNGDRKPRIEIVNKIAEVLETTTDYLLGNSDVIYPYNNNYNLSQSELDLLEKIKSDPELSILFNDLKSAPKKKIKQLLETWEFVNRQFEDMDKDDK